MRAKEFTINIPINIKIDGEGEPQVSTDTQEPVDDNVGTFIPPLQQKIELLKTKLIFRIIQYVLLILGILFLIIVNIPLIWLLVGLFSVIIFVYSISIQRSGVKIIQEESDKKKFLSPNGVRN